MRGTTPPTRNTAKRLLGLHLLLDLCVFVLAVLVYGSELIHLGQFVTDASVAPRPSPPEITLPFDPIPILLTIAATGLAATLIWFVAARGEATRWAKAERERHHSVEAFRVEYPELADRIQGQLTDLFREWNADGKTPPPGQRQPR